MHPIPNKPILLKPLFIDSLHCDKTSLNDRKEFLEKQCEKFNREIDHIKEKMKLEAKEYELRLQMLEYENSKINESHQNLKDSKALSLTFRILKITK